MKGFAEKMEAVREDTHGRVKAGLAKGGLNKATEEIRTIVGQVGLFDPWLMFVAGMELGRRFEAELEVYGEEK